MRRTVLTVLAALALAIVVPAPQAYSLCAGGVPCHLYTLNNYYSDNTYATAVSWDEKDCSGTFSASGTPTYFRYHEIGSCDSDPDGTWTSCQEYQPRDGLGERAVPRSERDGAGTPPHHDRLTGERGAIMRRTVLTTLAALAVALIIAAAPRAYSLCSGGVPCPPPHHEQLLQRQHLRHRRRLGREGLQQHVHLVRDADLLALSRSQLVRRRGVDGVGQLPGVSARDRLGECAVP